MGLLISQDVKPDDAQLAELRHLYPDRSIVVRRVSHFTYEIELSRPTSATRPT